MSRLGACGSLLKESRQFSPLAIFEVLRRDGSDDAGSRVPCQSHVLVESELEQLIAKRVLLIRRQVGPVFGDELPSLDRGQLAELRLGVAAEDLKECIEGGRRVVVVLVQGRSSGFDTLGVG